MCCCMPIEITRFINTQHAVEPYQTNANSNGNAPLIFKFSMPCDLYAYSFITEMNLYSAPSRLLLNVNIE